MVDFLRNLNFLGEIIGVKGAIEKTMQNQLPTENNLEKPNPERVPPTSGDTAMKLFTQIKRREQVIFFTTFYENLPSFFDSVDNFFLSRHRSLGERF